MNESYSVSCDYGGIGNFQEGDTACMLCPHEIECSHEQELATLEATRARRVGNWRYPTRSPQEMGSRTVGGVASKSSIGRSLQPSGRSRSRRPMPVTGESPFLRLVKNMTASALSSVGYEFGDFWESHDFAPEGGYAADVLPDKKG